MNKFQLKTYLSNALHPMVYLNFHIWKYLNLEFFQKIKNIDSSEI